MKKNKRFFSKFMTAVAVFASLFVVCDFANAATRSNTRTAPSARKNMTTQRITTVATTTETTKEDTVTETPVESVAEPVVEEIEQPELIISNKSNQFENAIYDIMESSAPDNSFAEEIRRQRAALEASESKTTTTGSQQRALATNSHACDVGLRKCMAEICGKDFTKCATDGDTAFGDKLNRCRRNTECTGEEFSLFTTEIKADRNANVKLASYNTVLECGNSYNACIMNECGTTYNKCLGKSGENSAIQKCSTIAKECREADSGLASRFGTAIGKLRENAEKDIKKDESRLYALRDLMEKQCKSLGATFDERSFDCVYTVNFYAGENQGTPLASRKAYAGDSFVCMQEWFGTDTTTYRENAYRETRAQTAASSAMLGSGLGMAAGLVSSGALNRAIDTQNAKKEYKNECESLGDGYHLENGECVYEEPNEESQDDDKDNNSKGKDSREKCNNTIDNALTTYHDKDGNCKVMSCKPGYKRNEDNTECIQKEEKDKKGISKKGLVCTGQIEHALLATYIDDNGNECRVKSCVGKYKPNVDQTKCVEPTSGEETGLTREELGVIVSTASNGDNAYKALNQYRKDKENEEEKQQDLADKIKGAVTDPTKLMVDDAVKKANAKAATNGTDTPTVTDTSATEPSTNTPAENGSNQKRGVKQRGTSAQHAKSENLKGTDCTSTINHATSATYADKNGNDCRVEKCEDGYEPNRRKTECIQTQTSTGTSAKKNSRQKTNDNKKSVPATPTTETDTLATSIPATDTIEAGNESNDSSNADLANVTVKKTCEDIIEDEFANGVPSAYRNVYKDTLNYYNNLVINTEKNLSQLCTFVIGTEPFEFSCQDNAYYLKDCDDANNIIPNLAKHFTKLRVKEHDCNIPYNRSENCFEY